MAFLRLEGRVLLSAVTVISSIGFLMIGYDNGLMGGFSELSSDPVQTEHISD
jgi:hypothetical protein